MLTYNKTTTAPRLVIQYDRDADNPRSHSDNLGYFITIDRKHESPDDCVELHDIIKDTGEDAKNQANHIELIKQEIKTSLGDNVIAIYPVVKHEHGNVSYKRGNAHGFDYSNNGFYIVTEKSSRDYGYIARLDSDDEDFKETIDQELELYTNWANGEVYCWTLYDNEGEEIECGGDYYSLEEIKAELTKKWAKEKMEDYLSNNY